MHVHFKLAHMTDSMSARKWTHFVY